MFQRLPLSSKTPGSPSGSCLFACKHGHNSYSLTNTQTLRPLKEHLKREGELVLSWHTESAKHVHASHKRACSLTSIHKQPLSRASTSGSNSTRPKDGCRCAGRKTRGDHCDIRYLSAKTTQSGGLVQTYHRHGKVHVRTLFAPVPHTSVLVAAILHLKMKAECGVFVRLSELTNTCCCKPCHRVCTQRGRPVGSFALPSSFSPRHERSHIRP